MFFSKLSGTYIFACTNSKMFVYCIFTKNLFLYLLAIPLSLKFFPHTSIQTKYKMFSSQTKNNHHHEYFYDFGVDKNGPKI